MCMTVLQHGGLVTCGYAHPYIFTLLCARRCWLHVSYLLEMILGPYGFLEAQGMPGRPPDRAETSHHAW